MCVCALRYTYIPYECRCPRRPEESQTGVTSSGDFPNVGTRNQRVLCKSIICSLRHLSVTRTPKYGPVLVLLSQLFMITVRNGGRK